MLARLFPDALFVFNTRRPEQNVDSLLAGWRSRDQLGPLQRERFGRAGYPICDVLKLQDYDSARWKFALVPGWRELRGKSVADVAAWQYFQCNHFAWTDLNALDPRRVFMLQHEEFVRDPAACVSRIEEWAGLPHSAMVGEFAARLPRVNDTRAKGAERGLRYEAEVRTALGRLPDLKRLTLTLGYGSESANVKAPVHVD